MEPGTEHYEEDERFDIAVPMPNGEMVYIEHASVDTAKETLGDYTLPNGDNRDSNC